MSKFIGLKTRDNVSVIINLNHITFLEVEEDCLHMIDNRIIRLNNPSTKFLLEVLMENEYKLEVEAE